MLKYIYIYIYWTCRNVLWAEIKCELSLRSIGRAVLYSGGAMLHRWIQQRSCGNRPASGCCEEAYYKLERCGQVRQMHLVTNEVTFNRSPKNENVFIIYSPSSCSKPVWGFFFHLFNTKEDILKNVGNQTVAGNHWLPLYFVPYFKH